MKEHVLMTTSRRLSDSAFEVDAAHLPCTFHDDVGFAEK